MHEEIAPEYVDKRSDALRHHWHPGDLHRVEKALLQIELAHEVHAWHSSQNIDISLSADIRVLPQLEKDLFREADYNQLN